MRIVAGPMTPPLVTTTAAPPPPAWSAGQLSLLAVITAVAAAVRLWQIEQWSWSGAEARSFQLLSLPADLLSTQPERWFPLLPWTLRQLDEQGLLAGSTEGWLRLPFAFTGMLTVPLLALVAAPVLGTGAAVLAALLLALHPWHIAASQDAAPAVVVAAGVLLVLGLLQRRRPRLAALAQLLVAAVHPLGWLAAGAAAVAAAAMRFPRLQTGLTQAVAVPAALAAGWWFDDVRPATLALVVVAVWVPALPRSVWLAVVALVALAGSLAWTGYAEFATAGLAALPGALAVAAGAAAALGRWWQQELTGRRWLAMAALVLVPVLAVSDGAIETWLRATLHHGNRPAWRAAKDLALGTVRGPGGLIVVAASGAAPLRSYLRPNDGREAGDPHPGVQVRSLVVGGDGAAEAGALAAVPAGASCVLVLRSDEVARLQEQAPAALALQRGFELWQVLPGPRQGDDDTLFLYRRRGAGSPAGATPPKPGG